MNHLKLIGTAKMKMSAYIQQYQALLEANGDLEVVGKAMGGGFGAIIRDENFFLPNLEEMKTKTSREWSEKICVLDDQPRTGEKVFLI